MELTLKQTEALIALYDQIDMIGKIEPSMVPYHSPKDLSMPSTVNRSSTLSTLVVKKLAERKTYGAGKYYKYRITSAGIRYVRESL